MGAELTGAVLSGAAEGARQGPEGVTAVVLTHKRPRLAGMTVRCLIDEEGFAPKDVVVVVNGEGGLDDPALESAVRMVRLPTNEGPALGFRTGLLVAFSDPATSWAYLCEDDMTLLHVPTPRVADLLSRVSMLERASGAVGAVAPFGRRFVPGSGHSYNFVPRPGLPGDLAKADVTTWGATLVSRDVVEAGVLPDPDWFFGFEDFDFFCSMRERGFSLLVDVPSARRVVQYQSLAGRDSAVRQWRPTDEEEPWRAYYFARNFFALARRHGRRSWIAWHLLYSIRRLQLAHSPQERLAILRGIWDGSRGRLGSNPRFQREIGERESRPDDPAVEPSDSPAPARTASGRDERGELARGVLAMIVTHNAPGALARCIGAIRAQSLPPAAVLVVDNGSTPSVEEGELSSPSLPVSVVRSEENLGPAGGWSIAFAQFARSSYDHAWVMDDDIVPDPDCLEVLLESAEDDPKRSFNFPRSVQPDGTVGEWGSWCGFLISRHIVEVVGVPRAELFWWAEDNEYCHWRVPHAGFERRIVDGALVQHDAIRQGARVPMWKYYYEARNMLYLHLHVIHRVGWYPRNVTKLLARAIVRERGRRSEALRTIALGLVDGLVGRLGIRYPVQPMRESPDDSSAFEAVPP